MVAQAGTAEGKLPWGAVEQGPRTEQAAADTFKGQASRKHCVKYTDEIRETYIYMEYSV